MFETGHQIQDLAVRPHERIALMRLLICIAQSALDGPEDYDDWNGCRPRLITFSVGKTPSSCLEMASASCRLPT